MAIKILRPHNESTVEEHAGWVANQNFKRVLDVGGAATPLRCATHVSDILPYESRRTDVGRGPEPTRYSRATWILGDINLMPWPFEDDAFDYVWCCQVVEDIRDPIGALEEMQRISKRGFCSTVHRQFESSVVQEDGVVGYHHHRWLIEADERLHGTVRFTFKSPILHTTPALRPPLPLASANWLLSFAWERPFEVKECFCTEGWLQREELSNYLKERRWETQ